MNALRTLPPPIHTDRVRQLLGPAAGALALAVALFGALALVRGPDFVSRVEIVNQTDFDLDVRVANARRDSWLGLNVAQAGSTTIVRDVVDQEDTWIFHFSRAGTTAGELRMTRTQLENSDWQVIVPEDFDEPLLADGQRPLP